MRKKNIINSLLTIVSIFSFFKMLAIENTARLPEYINTDYHMNSLPFIYICLLAMLALVILNTVWIIKSRKIEK